MEHAVTAGHTQPAAKEKKEKHIHFSITRLFGILAVVFPRT